MLRLMQRRRFGSLFLTVRLAHVGRILLLFLEPRCASLPFVLAVPWHLANGLGDANPSRFFSLGMRYQRVAGKVFGLYIRYSTADGGQFTANRETLALLNMLVILLSGAQPSSKPLSSLDSTGAALLSQACPDTPTLRAHEMSLNKISNWTG